MIEKRPNNRFYIAHRPIYGIKQAAKDCIVVLQIPTGSIFYCADYKIRTNKAKVIKIFGKKDTEKETYTFEHLSNIKFYYRLNKMVYPEKDYCVGKNSYASGIHLCLVDNSFKQSWKVWMISNAKRINEVIKFVRNLDNKSKKKYHKTAKPLYRKQLKIMRKEGKV